MEAKPEKSWLPPEELLGASGLPDEPLVLHADFARIEQVIANLINNAARYTTRSCTAARSRRAATVRAPAASSWCACR